MTELLEAARVAELTLQPDSNDGGVSNQISEIKTEIQKLNEKWEKIKDPPLLRHNGITKTVNIHHCKPPRGRNCPPAFFLCDTAKRSMSGLAAYSAYCCTISAITCFVSVGFSSSTFSICISGRSPGRSNSDTYHAAKCRSRKYSNN